MRYELTTAELLADREIMELREQRDPEQTDADYASTLEDVLARLYRDMYESKEPGK